MGLNTRFGCFSSFHRLEGRESRCHCAGVQVRLALGFSQHLLLMGMTAPLVPPTGSSMGARQPGAARRKHSVFLLLDRHPKDREGKRDANEPGVICHVERKLLPRDCKIASAPNASQDVLVVTVIQARKNIWICY